LAPQARTALTARLAFKVLQDQLVQLAQPAQLVQLVQLAQMGLMERPDLRDQLGRRV
jgi:hypothetical protein